MPKPLPPEVIDHIAALLANLEADANKGIRWSVCGEPAKAHYRGCAERSIRETAYYLRLRVPTTVTGAITQRLKLTEDRTGKREHAVRMASAAKTLNAQADRLDTILFPKEPDEAARGRAA